VTLSPEVGLWVLPLMEASVAETGWANQARDGLVVSLAGRYSATTTRQIMRIAMAITITSASTQGLPSTLDFFVIGNASFRPVASGCQSYASGC